jgi:hypothetical protein
MLRTRLITVMALGFAVCYFSGCASRGKTAPLAATVATSPPSAADAVLSISGYAGSSITTRAFSVAELKAIPRATVVAVDHDGKEHAFEGVRVCDLLSTAGCTLDKSLRGLRLRDYLMAEATDNYAVIFSLPELDPAYTRHNVIVADTQDGSAFSTHDGPLRLVVEGELQQARWVRNLIRLTLRKDCTGPVKGVDPGAAPPRAP